MFVDFITEYGEYIDPPKCAFTVSVEELIIFEDEVQSLFSMCLHDVCSLILT
jgi:hypothetical protein